MNIDLVGRINLAYAELEHFDLAENLGNFSHGKLDALLSEICARPITTFQETMISAAKTAASSEDKCYAVSSIQNILRFINEHRVYEAYQSEFKNTKKDIYSILHKERAALEKLRKDDLEIRHSEDGE